MPKARFSGVRPRPLCCRPGGAGLPSDHAHMVLVAPLQYLSTRDAAPTPARLGFDEVLFAGLAPDGGLYVPERVPVLSHEEIAGLAGLSYAGLAAQILGIFAGPRIGALPLAPLVAESYAG